MWNQVTNVEHADFVSFMLVTVRKSRDWSCGVLEVVNNILNRLEGELVLFV